MTNNTEHPSWISNGVALAIEEIFEHHLVSPNRPFCVDNEITEPAPAELIEQYIFALLACHPDPQALQSGLLHITTIGQVDQNQVPNEVHARDWIAKAKSLIGFRPSNSKAKTDQPSAQQIITQTFWLDHVEPRLHPVLQLASDRSDNRSETALDQINDRSAVATPLPEESCMANALVALSQSALLAANVNPIFQASVQSRVLALLSTEKKSSKRLKDEMNSFFECNIDRLVLMTNQFQRACACAAFSKPQPKNTNPHLTLDSRAIRKSHLQFIENAYQISRSLVVQINGKEEGLFSQKDMLSLSLADQIDTHVTYHNAMRVFHTLAKEYMEPSSRIARVEFALDRAGMKPQNSVAWGFFKNALLIQN